MDGLASRAPFILPAGENNLGVGKTKLSLGMKLEL
jgi:hypothetical protein